MATYGLGDQHLLVDLDGVPVLSTFDEPENWNVIVPVAVGFHVLTARIHDEDVSKTVDFTLPFQVLACSTPTPAPTDSGSGDDGGPDCCPGPDPVVKQSKKSLPRVKGTTATRTTTLNGLQPLNSVFRSVFGRTPTFAEWTY
ncbi:MAG: hypothetical protein ACRD4B_00115, partial [Acidobacteriota bacterium]